MAGDNHGLDKRKRKKLRKSIIVFGLTLIQVYDTNIEIT
jgi:hypothetical protein